MLANIEGVLMSLIKMKDFSFVSCFDNTGYRIMCSPHLYLWKTHSLKNTLKGEHILV